jgi:hypothetical protein
VAGGLAAALADDVAGEAAVMVAVAAAAAELDKDLAGGTVVVAAAELAVPFEPAAASVSFSFQCYVQAAQAFALVLSHHCTR